MREIGTRTRLAEIVQDAVYAMRLARREPGFTAVAVLTLALGGGSDAREHSQV